MKSLEKWTFLCCLLCLSCFQHGFSQDASIVSKVNRLLYYGKYAEARSVAESQLQRATGDKTFALYAAGQVAQEFQHISRADSLYAQVLLLFEQKGQVADSLYLLTCTRFSNLKRVLGDMRGAEALIKKGLLAAEACKNSAHGFVRANLLQEYAFWDTDMSRFQNARLHHEQAIALVEELYGKKHPRLGEYLVAYASFVGDYLSEEKEADQLLLRAGKILKPLATSYPKEYVSFLQVKAALYSWGLPRYQESARLLEESIEHCRKYLSPEHLQELWGTRLLAAHYKLNSPHFQRADSLIQVAKSATERQFGQHFGYYIGALQDEAAWLGDLGRRQDATKIRQKAYQLTRETFGPKSPSTANLMLATVSDLENEGRPLEADSLLNLAERIYTAVFGIKLHNSTVQVLIARAKIASDNLPLADSLYTQALKITEELYGAQSPEKWDLLDNLAQIEQRREHYYVSDSLWNELSQFHKKRNGPYSLKLNLGYQALLYSLTDQKKWKEGEALVRSLQQNIENAVGKDCVWYVQTYYPVVQFYREKGDTSMTLRVLDEYEQLALRLYGPHSWQLKMCYNQRKFYASENRRPSEEIEFQKKVLQIEQNLGDDYGSQCYDMAGLAGDLFRVGQYAEGDSILATAREIAISHFGKNSGEYQIVCQSAVSNYLEQGDFARAEAAMQDFAAASRALGKTPPEQDYYYLIMMGRIYSSAGRMKEAEQIMLQLSKIPGVLNEYGFYNFYGSFLIDMEQYQKADSLLRYGLKIREKSGQNCSFFYNNIAVNYTNQGNYKSALEYMKIALDKARISFGENNLQYAGYLANYAIALKDRGLYLEADSLYRETMRISARISGRNTLDYAGYVNSYAVYLNGSGQFQRALDSMNVALGIYRRKLGTDHPQYINQLENFVALELSNNQLKEAEETLSFLAKYWKSKNPGSSQYASIMGRMADFYAAIGQYDKSIEYNELKKEIIKVKFGASSVKYADVQNALGRAWEGKKEYRKALQYYESALAIDSLASGEQSSFVSFDWHKIAKIHLFLNEYNAAETCILHSLDIKSKIFKDYNTYTGSTLELQAELYEKTNRLALAEKSAREAIVHQAATVGEKDVLYASAQQRLASILFKRNQNKEAEDILVNVQRVFTERIRLSFGYLPFNQQKSLIELYSILDFFPSRAAISASPILAGQCYNNAILLKGAILQNSRTLRDLVSNDPTVLKTYNAYILTENTIASLNRLPKDMRLGLDSLTEVSRQLEKQLLQSNAYQAHVDQFKPDWRAVQAKLKKDEAAVEFIRYNRYTTNVTDTFYYAALVLRPTMEAPVFIPLPFSELEMEQALGDNEVRKQDYVANLYQNASRGFILTGKTKGQNLYELIWKPLDKVLSGAQNVYYAPVGLLHRLNMDALPCGEDSIQTPRKTIRLSERYKLIQLRSTRLIASVSPSAVNNEKTALLAGGIDFGPGLPASRGAGSLDPSSMWKSLNGTEDELKMSESILNRKGYKTIVLKKSEATAKAYLEQLKSKPRIAHAATHAFFAPDPRKNQQSAKRGLATFNEPDPLQRSALVFAGANIHNDSVSIRQGYLERGYLTAKDIAALDLRGTELVVLSACETGLGDIQNSEGVYGLQRSFLQAGARYVMMSLWEVDDASSADFMSKFYEQYIGNGKTVREAFSLTQQAMRNKYQDDVYKWGAFILIE